MGREFDEKLHGYGKLLAVIIIPMTIPIIWLINFCLQWIKKDHTYTAYGLGTASLEINCIVSYSLLLIIPVIIRITRAIFNSTAMIDPMIYAGMIAVVVMIYLFFRRAYQTNWWVSIIALLIFIVGYVVAMEFYRLLSFLIFI